MYYWDMPDRSHGEYVVWNTSQAESPKNGLNLAAVEPGNRYSSASPPRRYSQSSSTERSKTPLSTEEPSPSSATKKRTVSPFDQDDKEPGDTSITSVNNRNDIEGTILHVCICPPDPKIPRPRNAFILYRQHHQARVAAQHPGLNNPEISKIIGEQWQQESLDAKNTWKALAEEEKLRHQQQHPTYRYQPKRNGRRSSQPLESNSTAGGRVRCSKCGGRTISAPLPSCSESALSPASSGSEITSQGHSINPLSRTLPALRELSLQSPTPAGLRTSIQEVMTASQGSADERVDIEPSSPGTKRRRIHDVPVLTRVMTNRSATPSPNTGVLVGPGTPFPFAAPLPHPYPPAIAHGRRESLPSIRGVLTPTSHMGPPHRPAMGYQQHRVSQGHASSDRSLTLAPLRTGKTDIANGASSCRNTNRSPYEQIMSMDFRYKAKILNQVAPPTPVSSSASRGPLIGIEGDDANAVDQLGLWLQKELSKTNELHVRLLDGPEVSGEGSKRTIMANYHRLVAEWLEKSDAMLDALSIRSASPADSVMVDIRTTPTSLNTTLQSNRDVRGGDSKENESSSNRKRSVDTIPEGSPPTTARIQRAEEGSNIANAPDTTQACTAQMTGDADAVKPVHIIANYSLHASNFFACHIPITPHDPYSPSDHWQWAATQWRGVISPDLTIYVRDASPTESAKPAVEFADDINLCVLKRTKEDGMEASSLRRLGFEVSEWIRGFGSPEDTER